MAVICQENIGVVRACSISFRKSSKRVETGEAIYRSLTTRGLAEAKAKAKA